LNDAHTIKRALNGVTSVVSFLGAYITLSGFLTRRATTPIADSFSTLFTAMREANVKRILALSTPGGFPQTQDHVNWGWWLFGVFLPKIVVPEGDAEMARIGKLVSEQEDLEWTVFRVPHLNDGDAGLEVVPGYLGEEYKGSRELSRGSLARWVLRELDEGVWVGKAPVVGNPW
jgi:hypothetical protein